MKCLLLCLRVAVEKCNNPAAPCTPSCVSLQTQHSETGKTGKNKHQKCPRVLCVPAHRAGCAGFHACGPQAPPRMAVFTLQHCVLRLDRLISLVLACDAGMKLRATGDQPPAAPLGARVLCASACPIRAVTGAVYENSPTVLELLFLFIFK